MSVEVRAKGEFNPTDGTLTVSMDLLPATELVHEMLAALLDEDEKPTVSVDYSNVKDVITAKLVFKSPRDIVKIGKAGLDLKVEARDSNPPITVEELVKRKNAQTAATVKAAKAK